MMQGAISAQVLSRAIADARKAVPGGIDIPILKCIKLSACSGVLTVTASNLDQWVELRVPAELSDGDAVFEPGRFSAVLSRIAGVAQLATGAHGLTISGKGGRGTVATLPADGWPEWPQNEEQASIKIDLTEINKGFASVAGSVSSDASRWYLAGPHIFLCKGELLIQATNGHSVLRNRFCSARGAQWPTDGAIVPREFTALVAACLPEGEGILTPSRGKITIASESGLVSSKLIDGRYPDVDRIYDPEPELTLRADRKSLIEALKAADKFSEATTSKLHIIGIAKGKVYAFGTAGEAADFEFECEHIVDDEFWFGAPDALTGLTAFAGETVELCRSKKASWRTNIEFRSEGLLLCVVSEKLPLSHMVNALRDGHEKVAA